MDRLAAHIAATAALTAAFALVPFALAQSVGSEKGWDHALGNSTLNGTQLAANSVSDEFGPGPREIAPRGLEGGESGESASRTVSDSGSATGAAGAGAGVSGSKSGSTVPVATGAASASASTSVPVSASASASATAPATGVTPCSDAYQIGQTDYATWNGITAFTVKQYYSPKCHARYGYADPTAQFLAMDVSWDLGMAVFDVTHDAIDGAVTYSSGQSGPVYWSTPVDVAAGTCTEGLAHVFYANDETDTYTSKVCV